ncbi:MAG: hypothetical protein ACRCW1_02225 [Anaerotignaceae bacterium]
MYLGDDIMTKEAEMQIKALKKISQWKMFSMGVSIIGVALTYAGMAGLENNIFMSILGIAIIIISTAVAIILNLGLKNGRKNVEKILACIENEVVL